MLKDKNILFDFDGTINNSFKRHYRLHQKICSDFGIKSKLKLSSFIKKKRLGLKNINLFLSTPKLKKKYIKEWLKYIESKEFLINDKLFPNIKKILTKLKKNNKLFLNTYRQSRKNFIWQVQNYGIDKYFDKIYFISNKKYKSKKEYFKKKKFKNIIIVGDTLNDLNILDNKKATYFSVLTGYSERSTFLNRKTQLIKSLEFLVKFK